MKGPQTAQRFNPHGGFIRSEPSENAGSLGVYAARVKGKTVFSSRDENEVRDWVYWNNLKARGGHGRDTYAEIFFEPDTPSTIFVPPEEWF